MKTWALAGVMAGLIGCSGQQTPPKVDGGGKAVEVHGGHETTAPGHDDEAEEHHAPPAASAPASAPLPGGLLPLTILLPVPDPAPPPGFPTASTNDKECVRSVGLTGNLATDFSSLVTSCGANVGMKEYAQAAAGSLGPSHQRDTYLVKLAGGYCYRFFAMADGSVDKLNLRVERPNGALHSMISGKQPVILLRPGEAWCRRRDREFHITVEAPGGEGKYSFGIWARPSEKGRAK